MKRFLRRFNVSIFKKVIMIFGVIVLAVYIMFISVIDLSRRDLKQKNIELTKAKVEFAFNSFEKQLLNTREQQNYLINSSKLDRLINDRENPLKYDQISTINEIRETVSKIMYSNKLVSDLVLYLPTIGKKVSPQYIEDIDMDELKGLLLKTENSEDKVSLIGDDVIINIMAPFQHYFDSNVRIPYSLVSVRISKENIKNYFGQLFNEANMGYAVFLMPKNSLVVDYYRNTKAWDMDGFHKLIKEYDYTPGLSDIVKKGNDIYYIMQSPKLGLGFSLKVENDYFYSPLKKYTYLFVVVSVITFMAIVIFFITAKNIINKPLTRMVEAFGKVELGNFELNLDYDRDDEFKFLYNGFNKMINRIRDLIHQVYEQRLRMQEAELKQLQYQINPHFLYNSLFVLHEMIKFGDDDNAMKMARHLSSYYKYIIKNKSETIPLEHEFEHVKNYIEIQNFRYVGRIAVRMDAVPEEYKGFVVPRLIIQPIVENAYKHGLKNVEEGGVIDIRIEDDDGFLRIFVEDNGGEVSQEDLSQIAMELEENNYGDHGTGLANVHKRIRIMYSDNSGIFVSIGNYGGLCVEMRIKIQGGMNDVQTVGC